MFVWCLGNSWPELRHCWPSCVLASPNWWSSATSTTRLRSPPAAGSTRWRVVSATGPIQQVYHALLFLPQKPHSSSSFFLSFFLSGQHVSETELAALQSKSRRFLRLRELLQLHSSRSDLVVMYVELGLRFFDRPTGDDSVVLCLVRSVAVASAVLTLSESDRPVLFGLTLLKLKFSTENLKVAITWQSTPMLQDKVTQFLLSVFFFALKLGRLDRLGLGLDRFPSRNLKVVTT